MQISLAGNHIDARVKGGNRFLQGGFTLIEVIVTLTIVALATSFVLPGLNSGLPHWRLTGAVRDMATLLKFARNQAVVSLRPLHVVLDKSRHLYWLDNADAPLTGDPSAGGRRKIRIYALPDDVNFGELAGGVVPIGEERARILFFPRGSSSGGEIHLRDKKGRDYTIKVDSATGYTTIGRRSG